MVQVVKLDEIRRLVDKSKLICEIEARFVLYSAGNVNFPRHFLHFDEPPGDVHIKYGAITEDDYCVLKVASAFFGIGAMSIPVANGLMLLFNQKTS